MLLQIQVLIELYNQLPSHEKTLDEIIKLFEDIYLGEENPTGNFTNMKVNCGNTTEEELKKEPYIECLKFSGMQMDSFSGFFGGEVRLGIYFDGQNAYPVTGFSISGNIFEKRGVLTLSKEQISSSIGYEGPKYIFVPQMDIA